MLSTPAYGRLCWVPVAAGALAIWWVRRSTRLALRQHSIFSYITPKRLRVPQTALDQRTYGVESRFQPRASDVVIATYHKTGTTLLAHICHQIRVVRAFGRGSMNLDDYYFVVPWTLHFWTLDIDPCADHTVVPHNGDACACKSRRFQPVEPSVVRPRIFKSHRSLAASYEHGKYIVTIRDPLKTLVSLFHFLRAKRVPGLNRLGDLLTHEEWLNPFRCGDIWDYFLEAWEVCSHERMFDIFLPASLA